MASPPVCEDIDRKVSSLAVMCVLYYIQLGMESQTALLLSVGILLDLYTYVKHQQHKPNTMMSWKRTIQMTSVLRHK